jgi:hypothetical protein
MRRERLLATCYAAGEDEREEETMSEELDG